MQVRTWLDYNELRHTIKEIMKRQMIQLGIYDIN